MFAHEIGRAEHTTAQGTIRDTTLGTGRGMWIGTGLASVAGGILLVAGHLLDLGGHPRYGTVLGQSLVLAAHLVLVFALVGLYAAQARRSGLLGSVGMVVSVLSTALVSSIVLVEIAGAAGTDVEAVL